MFLRGVVYIEDIEFEYGMKNSVCVMSGFCSFLDIEVLKYDF